jgi:hypothetical protein
MKSDLSRAGVRGEQDLEVVVSEVVVGEDAVEVERCAVRIDILFLRKWGRLGEAWDENGNGTAISVGPFTEPRGLFKYDWMVTNDTAEA